MSMKLQVGPGGVYLAAYSGLVQGCENVRAK